MDPTFMSTLPAFDALTTASTTAPTPLLALFPMAITMLAVLISILASEWVEDLPTWPKLLALVVVPFWAVAAVLTLPKMLEHHPRLALGVGGLFILAAGLQGTLIAYMMPTLPL